MLSLPARSTCDIDAVPMVDLSKDPMERSIHGDLPHVLVGHDMQTTPSTYHTEVWVVELEEWKYLLRGGLPSAFGPSYHTSWNLEHRSETGDYPTQSPGSPHPMLPDDDYQMMVIFPENKMTWLSRGHTIEVDGVCKRLDFAGILVSAIAAPIVASEPVRLI